MRLMFFAGFLAFLADQVSKYVVIHMMGISPNKGMDVLPPVLNLRYGENRGVNFGLFGNDSETTRWTLIVVALVICLTVLIWVARNAQPKNRPNRGGSSCGWCLGKRV